MLAAEPTVFFFSSRGRHTRCSRDWSSDVCSSDLIPYVAPPTVPDTHVSGTVGGATYGIAKEVTLVAVRVLDCSGSGTTDQVIAGVDWVTGDHLAGQPASANMSLGGGFDQALNNAVENSIADGVTYAIAAGNSSFDACFFSPSSAPDALTVAASASNDARASFSNYGSCVDLYGPGVSITSDWNSSDDATNTISGTSMAAPHVAGAAALYLQGHLSALPAEVGQAIKSAATPNKITGNPSGTPNLLLYTKDFSAGPPPSPPAAPSNLNAHAVSSSQVDLTWTDNSNNEVGFRILRCQGAGCFDFGAVASVGPNTTQYSDVGRTENTLYRYQIEAFNAGGSSYSNVAEATTPLSNPPVAKYTWSCGQPGGKGCTFTSTSTDDIGITSTTWTFGDGTTGTGTPAKHVYKTPTSYTVLLTVQDAGNQTRSRSCQVQTGTSGTCQ